MLIVDTDTDTDYLVIAEATAGLFFGWTVVWFWYAEEAP